MGMSGWSEGFTARLTRELTTAGTEVYDQDPVAE